MADQVSVDRYACKAQGRRSRGLSTSIIQQDGMGVLTSKFHLITNEIHAMHAVDDARNVT